MTEEICEQHSKGDKKMKVLQLAIILSSSPNLFKLVFNLFNTDHSWICLTIC